MNKADVIEGLTARLGDKKVAAHAIDGFIDIIERAVAKGEKVSISGFGTFEKVARPSRMARNPRTGEQVKTKKTAVAKFRPGSTLKSVAAGETKKGREPKHVPLLPEGVIRMVAAQDGSATAAKPARAPRKTAASSNGTAAAKTTEAKATPAKKTTTRKTAATKSTATKSATAPATKTAAARSTTKRAASASASTAGAKAAPTRKTAARKTTSKATATKSAPAKKATTRKTKATASK